MMKYFAFGFVLVALTATAAVGGRVSAPAAKHDSPEMRDAIAHVTANLSAAIANYDLEWDDPPHVLSATDAGGDTVVREEIRMSTDIYSETPKHVRIVVRGVVSPLNWVRSIKVISHKELNVPKAGKG